MTHSSLKILIVEDEPISAMVLRQLVEEEGHAVCGIATDSHEALQAIKDDPPDVVFMDLILKDGPRGLELTRHIARSLELPVIILSGASGNELLEYVPTSGALSFLQKPVSVVSLRMNLGIAMRHRRITMRNRALQNNLAESEKKYRAIYNNAATGIYLNSPDGFFLTCNRAFAAILGYDDPDELLRVLRNEDEQLYAKAERRQELLALLQEKGEVADFESEVMGRDGDLLWISESCTPVRDADGNLLHYQGVVSDITERRQAEDAFRTTYNLIRTTIDSLQDGILVTNLDGYLIMDNNAAADIIGRKLAPGEKPSFLAEQPETGPFARFRASLVPQTGMVSIVPDYKPVHCTVVPYKNAAETVIGAVHVLRRNTEDKP